MSKVIVSHKNPLSSKEIDLNDNKWSPLLIENLALFNLVELRRRCSAYPNGIFPGGEEVDDQHQMFTIYKFENFMEFSKIMSDEVIKLEEDLFLTTKYFDQRKKGWVSNDILKKEGTVVGYCINGGIYHYDDREQVNTLFYETIYRSIILTSKQFIELRDFINNGIELILIGTEENFMRHLAACLLKNDNNCES